MTNAGVIRLILALLLSSLPSMSSASPFAYIPDPGMIGFVNVIDLASNRSVGKIVVGSGPSGVAISSNGKFVYVIDMGGRRLDVIDNATMPLSHFPDPAARVSFDSTPIAIAVAPDDRRLYVSLLSNLVSVIDTQAHSVVTNIPVAATPAQLAVNASGSAVYVPNQVANTVTVISAATNSVTATVGVGLRPTAVAVGGPGASVYVTNSQSNSVSVIDASTNVVSATIPVGTLPTRLALNPLGTRLYVTNHDSDSMSVIDTASNMVVATVAVGVRPNGVALTPDGRFAYVANDSPARMWIVDTMSNTVTGSVVGIEGIATGLSNFISAKPVAQAIEFYNLSLDHYFLSAASDEINKLDTGAIRGWTRTGASIKVFTAPNPTNSPVCRFYIPPAYGDSHFYSASPAECAQTHATLLFLDLEAPDVFYADLPNLSTGACPDNDTPVYRVWNQRADSNHRYTTDRSIRAQMIQRGYVAEGYGSDRSVMCAPF